MFDTTSDQLNKSGTIGIIPTDTVYGVVARASDQAAVARLYELKSRENKPGTVIAASIDQLTELGIARRYLTAVEQFWPGAISVIVPCGPELAYLHLGKNSLAVRVTDNRELQQLLNKTGPLLTTSANHSQEPTAVTITQAQAYFDGHVDFYVDSGDLSGHSPSTIIRIVDDAIEVLREGAVKVDADA